MSVWYTLLSWDAQLVAESLLLIDFICLTLCLTTILYKNLARFLLKSKRLMYKTILHHFIQNEALAVFLYYIIKCT